MGADSAGKDGLEVEQGTADASLPTDSKSYTNGKSPVLAEVLEEEDGQSVVSDDFEETPVAASKRNVKSARTNSQSQSKGPVSNSAKEKEKRKRQEVMHLQQRLAALETILSEAGLMSHGDVENLMGTRGKLPLGPTGIVAGGLAAALGAGPELDLESDTEGAALTLEHLAFGQRKVEQTGPGPNAYGPTYPRSLSEANKSNFRARSNSNMGNNSDNRVERGASTDHTRPLETRPADFLAFGAGNALGIGIHKDGPVSRSAMADAIPQSMISSTTGGISADLLPSKPLNLKQHLYKPINSAVLNALEPTEVFSLFYQRSDIFVKALLAVLPDRKRGELLVKNLGLYFMDPTEAQRYFTPDECESLPEIWLTAARGSLWMSDFMAVHTLEHLQCIVVMGVFLMAQGMGLSRLGAEADPSTRDPPKWRAPWESVIKREVGRRLWWNVNDEDISDSYPLEPKPLSVRTDMSYHLARLRFAEISQRQIWQANASPHPPYSFILSVDTELRKAIANLPSYFSFDVDTIEPPPSDARERIFYWEKITINLSAQSRLMRLHRPWLSRGYKDRKYDYSRTQCIRAARNCLKLMTDDHGTAVFLERWWILLFYVTIAAVVILIDLLRASPEEMASEDCKAEHSEVLAALARMEQITTMSHPARGSVKVIKQLLHELEEKQQGKTILGKRKAEDDGWPASAGGLQRAVKKLITDNSDSPPSSANLATQTLPASLTSESPTIGTSGRNRDQSSLFPGARDKDGNYEASYADQLHNILPPDLSANSFQQYFPMEISYGANVGVASTGQFPNYENAELESMLASYLPSRPHSPDDLLARLNHQTGLGDQQQQNNMWQGNPSSSGAPDLNFDLNALSNPYRGWMN
ncbi:hypothetical protein QFC21_003703 [Naganishia friedmannii]|uniref:Uncharacterized protein n=1 Tax=Naganishia friedmannii TaxID=89922 RepID=A0ACC2VMP1_9TREE|nr:hypothetical protein QFC21_003703 [Naganishia friedmannii]